MYHTTSEATDIGQHERYTTPIVTELVCSENGKGFKAATRIVGQMPMLVLMPY